MHGQTLGPTVRGPHKGAMTCRNENHCLANLGNLGTWKLGSLQPNVSTLDLKDEPMSIVDEEFMKESKIPSGNERGNHFRT